METTTAADAIVALSEKFFIFSSRIYSYTINTLAVFVNMSIATVQKSVT
jgi:hypothetical protein